MFGFLNIHKPAGPTSHDMVAMARRALGGGKRPKFKVGHAGTLDPFAEGVLVICLGPATRLADYLHRRPKQYSSTVMLGATSDTDDPTGKITSSFSAIPPNEADVRSAVEKFAGEIQQIPPAHSAVQIGGFRAYKLARDGETVNLKPRSVTIYSINVVSYDWPTLTLDITCGSGTYIRALARDIGMALGVGGYCQKLTRTAVGAFTLNKSVTLEKLDPMRDLRSPLLAVDDLPHITVDDSQIEAIRLGQRVKGDAAEKEVALVGESGELLALGKSAREPGLIQPTKVFVSR